MTPVATHNSSSARAGMVMLAAVVLAMAVANSPLTGAYEALWHLDLTIGVRPLTLTKSLLHWINDGLMAVFFLHVGLEIKHELVDGELSDARRASLPAICAAGGMLLPALIYVAVAHGDATLVRGWPVPTATDIALALGILALAGSRVPAGLRVFLLALAVIDDLGAVLLIALLFTNELAAWTLGLAFAALALLAVLNRLNVRRLLPYLLIGFLMWLAVLKSGVHATLAGVALGLLIPHRGARPGETATPLARLEHGLQPYVAFVILPLFAFANAGVPLAGVTAATLLHPVTCGIALGLFVGKQLGIFGFAWAALRLGVGSLPAGVTLRHIYGVALLAGIGFTMSLFIGSLAFAEGDLQVQVRIGVLCGSTLSAIAGFLWLRGRAPVRPALTSQ